MITQRMVDILYYNSVKKLLNDSKLHHLDDDTNLGIYKPNINTTNNIKDRIKKISKLIKELKEFK